MGMFVHILSSRCYDMDLVLSKEVITIGIILVVLIVGYISIVAKPELKGRYNHTFLIDQLRVGDEVVLISGLYGIVNDIDRDAKTVDIDCEGVYFKYDLGAVVRLVKAVEDRTIEQVDTADGVQ